MRKQSFCVRKILAYTKKLRIRPHCRTWSAIRASIRAGHDRSRASAGPGQSKSGRGGLVRAGLEPGSTKRSSRPDQNKGGARTEQGHSAEACIDKKFINSSVGKVPEAGAAEQKDLVGPT